MTPADAASIRARCRPGAIALVWVWRAVSAWLVAGPVAAALMSGGVDLLPNGDAALFEPGGLMLIEAVRTGARALRVALHHSAWTLMLMTALGLVPLSLLLVALAHDGKLRVGEWIGRALEHVPALVFVAGIGLLLQGLVALLATLATWGARSLAADRLDVRGTDLVTVAVASVGIVAVLLVGIYADLARAALVRHRRHAREALVIAAGVFKRRAVSAVIGWLVPGLWSVATLIAAALVVGALHVERPQVWRVACALIVHQTAAITLVALRAMWLAQALRLSATAAPASDD